MTEKEFSRLSPGRTILDVKTDESVKRVIFKFFLCDHENFDGYWLCCTEDLSNPYPNEVRDDDWNVTFEYAEIVDMHSH